MRKPIKPGSEKAITKHIRDWLKFKGIFHWKVMQGLGCTPGVPDIICILPPEGRFIGIEVKTQKGKQNENQVNFERMITASGGIYILARSLDDVLLVMEPRVLLFRRGGDK